MNFYGFRRSNNFYTYRGNFDASSKWEPRCRQCNRSTNQRLPPFEFWIQDLPLPDIAFVPPQDFIVKNKVKEVIDRCKFTGVNAIAVEIKITEEKMSNVPLDIPFWFLDVSGSARLDALNNCTPIDICSLCNHKLYSSWDGGFMIQESSWDGSDFFRILEHPGYVIVSEEVKKVFETEKYTGVSFVPVSEIIDKLARFRSI